MKNKEHLQFIGKLAALMSAFTVILGAFGAHSLKALISKEQIITFQTGINYQFYHTLAILLVYTISLSFYSPWIKRSAVTFFIGILLFSGSLYLLACKDFLGLDASLAFIGPSTPIGGVFFILGWIFLFIGISKKQN